MYTPFPLAPLGYFPLKGDSKIRGVSSRFRFSLSPFGRSCGSEQQNRPPAHMSRRSCHTKSPTRRIPSYITRTCARVHIIWKKLIEPMTPPQSRTRSALRRSSPPQVRLATSSAVAAQFAAHWAVEQNLRRSTPTRGSQGEGARRVALRRKGCSSFSVSYASFRAFMCISKIIEIRMDVISKIVEIIQKWALFTLFTKFFRVLSRNFAASEPRFARSPSLFFPFPARSPSRSACKAAPSRPSDFPRIDMSRASRGRC